MNKYSIYFNGSRISDGVAGAPADFDFEEYAMQMHPNRVMLVAEVEGDSVEEVAQSIQKSFWSESPKVKTPSYSGLLAMALPGDVIVEHRGGQENCSLGYMLTQTGLTRYSEMDVFYNDYP